MRAGCWAGAMVTPGVRRWAEPQQWEIGHKRGQAVDALSQSNLPAVT